MKREKKTREKMGQTQPSTPIPTGTGRQQALWLQSLGKTCMQPVRAGDGIMEQISRQSISRLV